MSGENNNRGPDDSERKEEGEEEDTVEGATKESTPDVEKHDNDRPTSPVDGQKFYLLKYGLRFFKLILTSTFHLIRCQA